MISLRDLPHQDGSRPRPFPEALRRLLFLSVGGPVLALLGLSLVAAGLATAAGGRAWQMLLAALPFLFGLGVGQLCGRRILEQGEALWAERQALAGTLAEVVAGTDRLAQAVARLEAARGDGSQPVAADVELAAVGEARRAERTLGSIHGSVGQLGESVAQAQELTSSALQHAGKGVTVMQTLAGSIEVVAQAVERATETMQGLQQRSVDIDDIVALIKDVADQTKLIALNAAIEAARAGAHGRGFAVVADAVRRLAEQTSQATRQVSHLLDKLHRDTLQSVHDMQEAYVRVGEGVDQSRQAAESLLSIHDSAERSVQTIDAIAEAAHGLGAASGDAAEALTRLGLTRPRPSSTAVVSDGQAAAPLAELRDEVSELRRRLAALTSRREGA